MIDKKKIIKSLIIISLIIIIITVSIQIRKTLARYETTTSSEKDVDVAFWIVDNDFKSDRILIEDIYPSAVPYEYTFSVSNFSDTKNAETDLEYEILITTTTNLPLSYTITREGVTCTKTETLENINGTINRKILLETDANNLFIEHENDTTDDFVLKVTFPQSYSANPEYADLMEDIKIDLTARQRID